MTKTLKKSKFRLLAALCVLVGTVFIIHSCKKDHGISGPNTDVLQAKAWYESTYAAANSSKINVASVGGSPGMPLNALIKPGWDNAISYTRLNKLTIEIPLDTAVKFGLTTSKNGFSFNNNPSKSTFLILSDGKNYTAYIMTIVADSAYLQNDYSKLNLTSYRKRDPNFSGYVFYSTPAGNLVGGWHYLNGNINKTIAPSVITTSSGSKVQSIQSPHNKLTLDADNCSISSYQVYLGSSCISAGDGSVAPTCTYYYGTRFTLDCTYTGGYDQTVDTIQPDDLGLGGPPPILPPDPIDLTIKEDSLKAHFPCATKLITDSLLKITDYFNLVRPFTTNLKPDLVWQDGMAGLPWNVGGNYQTGQTLPFDRSATITLSDSLLARSSQLLIAATAIHETLHGVINFNVQTATGVSTGYYPPTAGFDTGGSWLYSLDSWALIKGLPTNYSNHYEMLSDYFNKAVSILSTWDNGAHTLKEYQEAMLFGLDNAKDGTPAQQLTLQTEFNLLLTQNGITRSDLNSFNLNNLRSKTEKLPTSGCN